MSVCVFVHLCAYVCWVCVCGGGGGYACVFVLLKGEVKAKIKISPVVVFGVLSRMVLVRES